MNHSTKEAIYFIRFIKTKKFLAGENRCNLINENGNKIKIVLSATVGFSHYIQYIPLINNVSYLSFVLLKNVTSNPFSRFMIFEVSIPVRWIQVC